MARVPLAIRKRGRRKVVVAPDVVVLLCVVRRRTRLPLAHAHGGHPEETLRDLVTSAAPSSTANMETSDIDFRVTNDFYYIDGQNSQFHPRLT